jgi:hypothetical protein
MIHREYNNRENISKIFQRIKNRDLTENKPPKS